MKLLKFCSSIFLVFLVKIYGPGGFTPVREVRGINFHLVAPQTEVLVTSYVPPRKNKNNMFYDVSNFGKLCFLMFSNVELKFWYFGVQIQILREISFLELVANV